GGGYELALACDHIILADDGSSNVALPEIPLLAVLPGTGGLTRVPDKRKVRRGLADVFCSVEEGVKGKRAAEWHLVDGAVPNSKFEEIIAGKAQTFSARSARAPVQGITLTPLSRTFGNDGAVTYSTLEVAIDRNIRIATITISGPSKPAPADVNALQAEGAETWMLRCARELDDAILHLRNNEYEAGVIKFRSQGDPALVAAHEKLLLENQDHWFAKEILLYWKRVLKRIDLTSRSLVALIEPGSCFAGTLAEILFAADRSYMAEGEFGRTNRREAAITLRHANFGHYPMSNELTRLQTRFLGEPAKAETAKAKTGAPLAAREAYSMGLVTFAFDEVDWEDEIRVFLEERT